MDEEERFMRCYHSILFKENKNDPFSVARTRRNCLLLNYYGSIHLRQENEVTNYLLSKDLKAYEKAVDNQQPGQVNNYSEAILASLPPGQYDNRNSWKTSLDTINVDDLVEKLPCMSNGKNCPSTEVDEKWVKALREAIIKDEKPTESKTERRNNHAEAILSTSKGFFGNKSQELKHKTEEVNTSLKKELIKNGKPIESKSESRNYYTEAIPSTSKGFVGYKSQELKHKTQEVNTSLNEESNVKQKSEEPKWKGISFRTAREELHLQNLKRNRNNQPATSSEGTVSSVPVKKTLGTRKGGGVFGKFQPPTRIKENQKEAPKEVEPVEGEIDERLKNIDPKMVELIKNEIMDCTSKVQWDDIAGLEHAKNTIQEIVVWPMLRPDIFTGLRRPPKGILLFGPPGTGKTLIGKCIASQSDSTFFSISASSLTSKWIGDGEKMVRALFAVARCHQPAVVFIDEIDSLLSQRNETEHESSRRLKTEFLVQLDGAGTAEDDRILIIGATNRPQELDEAARRRLVKRLYIPLPDERARAKIIENLISKEKHCLSETEILEVAALCKGYSGADVKNLCQEASLGPIRSIPPLEIRRVSPDEVRPLNVSDFKCALTRIKSSVCENDLELYVKWDAQYGCGSGSF